MKKVLGVTILLLALMASHAAAVTGTGFAGDDLVARAYSSFTQVWIPVIALAALLGVIGALYAGHRVAAKVVGAVFIIVLLGGGLPYLASLSGGAIAAGATVEEGRCPCWQAE